MNCERKTSSQPKAKVRNCTEELLEELYKSVEMGKQSLINIMGKVKDTELSAELTSQLNEYSRYSDEICKLLCECGGDTMTESIITKMSAKIGVEMSTLTDSSDEHIAQMVIEGTTASVTDTIRLVRDYENSNCSEKALSLARNIVSYQEKTVEKMKKYL